MRGLDQSDDDEAGAFYLALRRPSRMRKRKPAPTLFAAAAQVSATEKAVTTINLLFMTFPRGKPARCTQFKYNSGIVMGES